MAICKPIGQKELSKEALKIDKKRAQKIGPVGMGKQALYLNNIFFSRSSYVLWDEVKGVYKRVAMSKGGFTQQGAFGAIAYLVVRMTDGSEKACIFKREADVDRAIAYFKQRFPERPYRSPKAEAESQAAQAQGTPLPKHSSKQAERAIQTLSRAQAYLNEEPALAKQMSAAAGSLRVQQMVPGNRRVMAWTIFSFSLLLMVLGLIFWQKGESFGPYFLLFGLAFLLFSLSSNLLPIGKNSLKKRKETWQQAVRKMQEYIDSYEEPFPVPARYAHPIVLEWMKGRIERGEAATADEALAAVKDTLRRMNKEVTVSQKEYEDVLLIKPLFLVADYE